VALATDAVFAASQASGAVVAVVHGDQARAMGFGRMNPGADRAADATTLVRLESVSKLFAGELLADLASRGKVKLSDPLALYAPTGWQAPVQASPTPPITLVNLATHTSGLPREATAGPGKAVDEGQPAAVASAARWAWLAQQRRLPSPGAGALYSNVAFDLLGDALNASVTGPLGMADTTARPSAEQCRRMMAGDPDRKPFPCVDQSGEAASGGLYSTAGDMALWLKAQVAPGAEQGPRSISQAVYVRRAQLATAIGLDHAGPADGVGLAWIEQDASGGRPRLLEKTGGGDGFLTFVVIDPVHRAGVFVGFDNVSGHRLGEVAAAADALVILLGSEPDSIAIPGSAPTPAPVAAH